MSRRDKSDEGTNRRAERQSVMAETASELGILDRAETRNLTESIADSYADGGRMVRKIIRRTAKAMDDIADGINRDRDPQ